MRREENCLIRKCALNSSKELSTRNALLQTFLCIGYRTNGSTVILWSVFQSSANSDEIQKLDQSFLCEEFASSGGSVCDNRENKWTLLW